MSGELFDGKQRLGRVILNRVGKQVDVLRADGSATENKYGKIEDDERSYDVVGQETARRIYANESDRPGEADVTGGRLDSENPRILFGSGADVTDDDRVRFPDNKVYVLDEEAPLDTHTSYRVTLVNG